MEVKYSEYNKSINVILVLCTEWYPALSGFAK